MPYPIEERMTARNKPCIHFTSRKTGLSELNASEMERDRAIMAKGPLRWFAALAMLITGCAAWAAGQLHYRIDPPSSSVTAKVAFFGLVSKSANFSEMSGSVKIDPNDLQNVVMDVTIDARSLTAGDSITEKRLKGPDFFDIARYPSIRFTGSQLSMNSATKGRVTGKLTARGVTRPVVLSVSFSAPPAQAIQGSGLSFTGTTVIDRRDFGITAYRTIVGRQVTIAISSRLTAQ
jgi:polyisoprenoid-binding protein YceI